MKTRQLLPEESIPYELLLLADETTTAIEKYLFDTTIFIYEEQSEIIGIYVLLQTSADTIEIKNIAVREDWQGIGIGTFLLEDAQKRGRAQGFEYLTIGTARNAQPQLRLYRKVGFKLYVVKTNFPRFFDSGSRF